MVAFHAGFAWAAGGYLGVSTFFTLSGFLITSLLLEEQRQTGRIDLRRFWTRRFRRLLPASLLTLAAVSVAATTLATPEQLAGLRADVVAALLNLANWRFLFEGRSYVDLFSTPSPVLHFWSLAIEEQFYLLYPLGVAGVVAVSRRPRRLLGAVLLVVTTIAVGVGAVTTAYYSTVVRAPELLVGALLAVALGRPRPVPSPPARRAVAVGGPLALGGLLWAWSVVEVGGPGLYRGGFLLHALGSALVVVAGLQTGAVQRVLSFPPLRWLGRVSYGVYLFHWPIFVWLTPERAGADGLTLVGVQVAATLTLAALSLRLVELPVREGRGLASWRPALLAPAAAALVAVAVVVATVDPPATDDFGTDGLEAALASNGSPVPPSPASPPAAPAVVEAAPRLIVFGDSTALRTSYGLPAWGDRTGRLSVVDDGTRIGCSLGRGGLIDTVGKARQTTTECNEWPQRWKAMLEQHRPDVAAIQVGPWDVSERKLPGQRRYQHIGQPAYDAFLKSEMLLAVDVLSSTGARVVWLTSPTIELERTMVPRPTRPFPASDPARMARLNELIAEVATERPGVEIVDLAGHLRRQPGGELDPATRPDGVHISEEASMVLADWLAPALLAAGARDQTRSPSFQTGS